MENILIKVFRNSLYCCFVSVVIFCFSCSKVKNEPLTMHIDSFDLMRNINLLDSDSGILEFWSPSNSAGFSVRFENTSDSIIKILIPEYFNSTSSIDIVLDNSCKIYKENTGDNLLKEISINSNSYSPNYYIIIDEPLDNSIDMLLKNYDCITSDRFDFIFQNIINKGFDIEWVKSSSYSMRFFLNDSLLSLKNTPSSWFTDKKPKSPPINESFRQYLDQSMETNINLLERLKELNKQL